jgi:hypothetical protein
MKWLQLRRGEIAGDYAARPRRKRLALAHRREMR